MPVVPFDPARARPRGQARPPKLPSPSTSSAPPRAGLLPAGAMLPPGAVRPTSPLGSRPVAPLAPGTTGAGTAMAPSSRAGVMPPRTATLPPATATLSPPTATRWSSEPAGGVMMPAHVPPPTPRLAINLSPAAATRALAVLGLGVALSATVATTLTVIASESPAGLPSETPAAIAQLTNWLVSVPWLFVAVVLAASSRVERVVRPDIGPAWSTLALAAAACGAMQVVGRDLVSTWTLLTRAGLIVVATASLSLAFRQFLAGPSRTVRAQIVGATFAGLLAGLGPLAVLGRLAGVAGGAAVAPIDVLLSGADALLGLVLATLAIRATLVYVRDFLPDFNIALETAAETPAPELTAAR